MEQNMLAHLYNVEIEILNNLTTHGELTTSAIKQMSVYPQKLIPKALAHLVEDRKIRPLPGQRSGVRYTIVKGSYTNPARKIVKEEPYIGDTEPLTYENVGGYLIAWSEAPWEPKLNQWAAALPLYLAELVDPTEQGRLAELRNEIRQFITQTETTLDIAKRILVTMTAQLDQDISPDIIEIARLVRSLNS